VTVHCVIAMFALRVHVRWPTWHLCYSSVVIRHGRSRLVRPNMLPHAGARWINWSTLPLLLLRACTPANNLHMCASDFDDSSLWLSCSHNALHPTTCSRQAEVIGILAVCTYAVETWTPCDDGLPSRIIKRWQLTHTHLRRCLLAITESND